MDSTRVKSVLDVRNKLIVIGLIIGLMGTIGAVSAVDLNIGTIDPGAQLWRDNTLLSNGQTISGITAGTTITFTTSYNGTNYTDVIELWYDIDVSVHVNTTTANGATWYMDTDMGYTPYDIFVFLATGTGTYRFDFWTSPSTDAVKIIGLHTSTPNGNVRIDNLGDHSHTGIPANLAEVFYGTVENDNYLYIDTHCGGSGSMGSSFNRIVAPSVELDEYCKKNHNIRIQEIHADNIWVDDTETTFWYVNLTERLKTSDKFHGKSWNDNLLDKATLDDDKMLWFKARSPEKWDFCPQITSSGTSSSGNSWKFKYHKDGDSNFWETNLSGRLKLINRIHTNEFFINFLGPLTEIDDMYFNYKKRGYMNFYGDDSDGQYKRSERFDSPRGSGGTDFWNPMLTTSSPNGYSYSSGSIISPIHVLKLRSGLFYTDADSYNPQDAYFYLADNQDLLILSDTSDLEFDCVDGCIFNSATNSHWVVEDDLTYLSETPDDPAIDITQSVITVDTNDVTVAANNTYGNSTMYVAYRKNENCAGQYTRVNLIYNGSTWVTSTPIVIDLGEYSFYTVAVENDGDYGKVVESTVIITSKIPEFPLAAIPAALAGVGYLLIRRKVKWEE